MQCANSTKFVRFIDIVGSEISARCLVYARQNLLYCSLHNHTKISREISRYHWHLSKLEIRRVQLDCHHCDCWCLGTIICLDLCRHRADLVRTPKIYGTGTSRRIQVKTIASFWSFSVLLIGIETDWIFRLLQLQPATESNWICRRIYFAPIENSERVEQLCSINSDIPPWQQYYLV